MPCIRLLGTISKALASLTYIPSVLPRSTWRGQRSMEYFMMKKKTSVSERQRHQWTLRPIRKAVILAAGVGDRLRPLTDRLPKCLVPVNGVPILINTLTHLADSGIRETVIVVGHLKETILERIGDRFRGMKIIYVESERYATTNNIYSLWLAREYLDGDILLLEADVYFERELLDGLLRAGGENHAVVAHHKSWMSGTVVRLDDEDNIEVMVGSRYQESDFEAKCTIITRRC